MTRVAAVDCGTNTIKLLVVDLDPAGGGQREMARENRMVRLGQDVDRTGRLAEEALARVLAAVEEYAGIVAGHRVDAVRFCATSAARDAANADALLGGVRRRLGVEPEVLSGDEEARLSFAGATQPLGDVSPPVLVVDVGGGSTELVLGSPGGGGGRGLAAVSLDVGSVRMTERLLPGDPPAEEEIASARAEVDRALGSVPGRGIASEQARTVVVVSGTGLTVAAAVLELPALTRAVDGAVLSVADVHRASMRLLGMSVAQRRALPFMHPGRADVIGAGALILDRVLARCTVSEVRASVHDILDGIAWSMVDRPR